MVDIWDRLVRHSAVFSKSFWNVLLPFGGEVRGRMERVKAAVTVVALMSLVSLVGIVTASSISCAGPSDPAREGVEGSGATDGCEAAEGCGPREGRLIEMPWTSGCGENRGLRPRLPPREGVRDPVRHAL